MAGLNVNHALPKTPHLNGPHGALNSNIAGHKNQAQTNKSSGKQASPDSKGKSESSEDGGSQQGGAATDAARNLPISGRGGKDSGGQGGSSDDQSPGSTKRAGKAGAAGQIKSKPIVRANTVASKRERRAEHVSNSVAGGPQHQGVAVQLTKAHIEKFKEIDPHHLHTPPSAALSSRSNITNLPFGASHRGNQEESTTFLDRTKAAIQRFMDPAGSREPAHKGGDSERSNAWTASTRKPVVGIQVPPLTGKPGVETSSGAALGGKTLPVPA